MKRIRLIIAGKLFSLARWIQPDTFVIGTEWTKPKPTEYRPVYLICGGGGVGSGGGGGCGDYTKPSTVYKGDE